ncbi:atrial natriuretic peptide receptor 1-like isoform X1 [Centruroides vittatus]|uniref:atrial natriuretic peptide receptor 1-like isoform X1 n=1 Tax=Centruroides vittatus TaxID=120091 RepID=UPI003510628B
MGNGDYVFISVEFFKNKPSFGDFSWYREDDTRNEDAKKIYEAFLLVSAKVPTTEKYKKFAEEVVLRSRIEFNTSFQTEDVNVIVADFHDCVLLFASALNQTLGDSDDPFDGRTVIRKMWNRTFYGGIAEEIHINRNGDREADYTLYDLDVKSGKMKAVIHYYGVQQILIPIQSRSISWPNGQNTPPLDVPICGFIGNDPECQLNEPFSILGILGVVAIAIVVIGLLLYRRMKLESELTSMWWKVKWNEIVFSHPSTKSSTSINVEEITQKDDVSGSVEIPNYKKTMSVGYFKGMKVAVKPLNIRKLHITRKLLLEFKQLRDVTHENLIRFIGFCSDEPNIALITEFSPRGSLRELLSNEGIKIDWPFRFSLISDIIEGMIYLHQSPVTYHGRLKSTNCVIDGRFVVKLTDFGLRTLLDQLLPNTYIDPRLLLWTAPEHLREQRSEMKGSQKGDVYSFGIVLREIITRLGPFQKIATSKKRYSTLQPQEVLECIKSVSDPPFRPNVSPDECPSELLELLHQCWEEDPTDRPTFSVIKQQTKKLTKLMGSSNFLDNLLSRMEQYANNLEQLVEEKTEAFLEEKKKSEELLYEVLPRYVAEQLKAGHHVRPENFACVTIFFSDIVGFTNLSAESAPMDIVDLLNELYTCFDAIIGNYDVYKVETIGDAYMVVSGLPERNGNEHARQIARMSLSLRSAIKQFKIRHKPERKLQLRIGIHSGPCAAGVVGKKMPRYCLFGDTVNTASRMETSGEAMKIHISYQTKNILDHFHSFNIILRGDIEVKGKGLMRTYWLDGENMEQIQKQYSI